MIDEAGAIRELRDCMKRATEITRQIGYARMDTRWISVNSLLAAISEKLNALIVAKSAESTALAKRTGDANRA